mgnify:FL=1|jgi:hypothetical protein
MNYSQFRSVKKYEEPQNIPKIEENIPKQYFTQRNWRQQQLPEDPRDKKVNIGLDRPIDLLNVNAESTIVIKPNFNQAPNK